MNEFANAIINIQRKIYMQKGMRTDAHFKDGYGVIFVPEFFRLLPQNVIHASSILELRLHSL